MEIQTNFGILNNLLNDIKIELSIAMDENKKFYTLNDINKYNNFIYNNLKDKYPQINFYIINDILTRYFQSNYTFNDDICFDNGEKCFRNLDNTFNNNELTIKQIKIPRKYSKLNKHFNYLYDIPQPEQKSQEWFAYRHERITASDTAEALDLSPYEGVEQFYVKKCDPEFRFLDNIFVHHGKKYEQIATQVYEHIYNTKVTEFGCVPHSTLKILGASPDGICSKSTLDCNFSTRLGTMLEIKCPFKRQINHKGHIVGEICPHYYWCQVQQQLECCDLEVCDFWQCNIQEYKSREAYLKDTEFTFKLTEGTDATPVDANPLIFRGCLIQLLPFEFTPEEGNKEDRRYFKSHYLYPPRLDMTTEEYDAWSLNLINTWQTDYPELTEKYYFDKIIYWKIPNSHNVEIKRDRQWFKDIYPVLEETWRNVQHIRQHPELLPEIKELAKKRKNFYWSMYRFNNNFKPFIMPGDDDINVNTNQIPFLSKQKMDELNKQNSVGELDVIYDSDDD